MSLRDRLLALLVAVIWGGNFPATAYALEHFPPLLMVAVRFTLVAVPTILLVPRPKVPLRWFIGTGIGRAKTTDRWQDVNLSSFNVSMGIRVMR